MSLLGVKIRVSIDFWNYPLLNEQTITFFSEIPENELHVMVFLCFFLISGPHI